MSISTDIGVWVAAFFTLSIFSFLYKDNPFYKFTEHVAVGVSAGYWFVVLMKETLQPAVIVPLKEGRWNLVPGPLGIFLLILPVFIGILLFFRFSKRYNYVARIPIALIYGIGAGPTLVQYLQNSVIRQMQPTMIKISLASFGAFSEMLIAAGVICGLAYFFFSKEHRGTIGGMAKVGIWTLMIGFGATFGFTVMARVSLLIGRFVFLMRDWLGVIG
jgi:hypothetical protein